MRRAPSKGIIVLLVDDEKKFLESISERIRLKGFEPLSVFSGEEAIDIAKKKSIDMAIVDLNMPGMDGLTTITKLKEIRPGIKTVLLTGYGNEKIKEAAEALESDYFEKDEMKQFWSFMRQFGSRSGMIIIKPSFGEEEGAGSDRDVDAGAFDKGYMPEEIEMQAARQTLERRLSYTDIDVSNLYSESRIQKLIGESPSILEIKRNIRKVASLDCTVLILGETGTGKELVARAIHLLSPRKERKFTAVNCGSFTEELLCNELFGHEREAFTGAHHLKRGVFEAASGGTILLDEIGDTPLSMQIKLLRVLENKTIVRVGGTDEVSTDVRVLAATNQSLKKKIDQGEFREDLYYRLNAFILRIPPLRERKDDIPLLSSYFLDRYRKEYGKDIKKISDEVLSIFKNYAFPGNVRELENAIERAVIVCEGDEVRREHLPQRFVKVRPSVVLEKKTYATLAELEEQYILEVLEATKGNKSEAARILGINRASLWRKLKQMDLET
ncbi:MAG: sigma-54-dependent Fis family transcriptional regulator [Deltaproteobacteria bacterium]|nr:sigma-54-dependent Fis family transcriptional regulator [Deltaproteobacteria bacterium]